MTGGRVVDVKRTVRGENGGVTVRVRPDSSGDLTVTLASGTAGGGSLTVPGPSALQTGQQASAPDEQPVTVSTPTPLTASFHGVPTQHNGALLSFEIRFSEEFDGLKLTALKQALQVTGGRIVDVKRTVRGENRSVTVRVRPAGFDPVTVTLPATSDCSAAGAICTSGGQMLSGSASASISHPAWGGKSFTYDFTPPDRDPPVALASTLKSIEISTTAPSGLPSGAGTNINMNTLGYWSDPRFQDGMYTNNGINLMVKRRQVPATEEGGGEPESPCSVRYIWKPGPLRRTRLRVSRRPQSQIFSRCGEA